MASGKPDLARAGTMQMTAKSGKAFLDKNLTEWKKPFLMTQFEEENGAEESSDSEAKSPPAKPKMAKHNTMKGTAKEAKALLAGEKLSDTRQETKAKKAKPALKKASTMAQAVDEAKVIYGSDVSTTGGRQLRKRKAVPRMSPKPAKMKRAGTMQGTAKEGKAFVKRGKKGKKGKN